MEKDTICALATANGIGAIGVVRVSGKEAISIVNKCFKESDLSQVKSHTVQYGFIRDYEEIIDEVMVSVFHSPKTFTGENSVEISFHGSPHIAQKILKILIKNGARMAKAGEFTMRAFINGRIDLAQAEAVADIIASENDASREIALNQLRGGVSSEISQLRSDLLDFTSLVELELDFSEEDVEFADRTAMLVLIENLEEKLESLIRSFQYGNAIKNGINVAIIGKPNVGKSTLLNALLKEERAIVSDIAGTTRDTIEEVLHIQGTAFRLIDTAGIRETTDIIETIGVQKAKEKISTAKILLYLYDEFDVTLEEVTDFIKQFWREDLRVILVHNKIDLNAGNTHSSFDDVLSGQLFPKYANRIIGVSAKQGIGVDEIKNELFSYINKIKTRENVVITNHRHYDALRRSLESVKRVKDAISQNFHTELLAYELRYALEYLGEISGEFTNDEILGNIFSRFCIGK